MVNSGVSGVSVIGVLARSQALNFHNNLKMSSLHCKCTDEMVASCEMPDSNWGTLLVCAGVILLILRHIRVDESGDDESESPSTMYS